MKLARKVGTIRVGDILWTHPYGQPEKWLAQPEVITGETAQSWIMGDSRFNPEKVNKKTLRETIPKFGYRQWYTEQGKIDALFIRNHRHQISAAILSCADVSQLKKIAEIIGMELA